MYGEFSRVYDSLMADADYKTRAALIQSLFEKYDRMPSLMLDLACGTGAFSRYFADKGVSVIGVDLSVEMLSIAAQKSAGKDILYLCQEMTELDLYGTVDGAVCCLDSLNHLESYDELCTTLGRVSLFLEKDRLFIFDINTPYKHKRVLGDNIFIKQGRDVYCVWQNEYKNEQNRVDITLDIFSKKGELYEKSRECFCETAYSKAKIEQALKKAGFSVVDALDEKTLSAPSAKTERVIYAARKIR